MNSRTFRRHALAAAVLLAVAVGVAAQSATATIKGTIAGAAAPAGLDVTAVNQANGNTYRTTTLEDGSYVFPGLAPGDYEIRVQGGSTQSITVAVGQTAEVDLAVAPAGSGQTVTIVGSADRLAVKTSEVGTNVSRRQIEALPQNTRNFLSSADLAPGASFVADAGGNTKIQAGAQNFDHVNVFIDGVSQKNNVLRGGLTGQDTSRGNPFPQSAISEYRVLTQNYKAELEQVSSVAITAITRSGTNEFQGEAYVDRTGTNWRAMSVFEKEREAQGVALPPSSKKEYGVAVGGPIARDRLHYFFAYDGKQIDDSRQVVPRELDRLPAGAGIVPSIVGAQGSQVDNFTEHLLFGKVDAQFGFDHRVSASVRLRREEDKLPEDRLLSLPGNDKNRSNDDTRFDLKHEWTSGNFLSEARIGAEDAVWNPRSDSTSPFVKYKVGRSLPQRLADAADVAFAGGSPDDQRRGQKGWYLSEDLTWTGLRGHVVKGGVKFKAMEYELSGTSRSVPIVETLIDVTTGVPYFDGTLCTGTNVTNGGLESDQCRILTAIAPAETNYKNNQLGLYIQDDWAVTRQLELNLGLRWDVESNMLNNDYVTPADRVAALFAPDVPRAGITPAPGQTYAESLALGGVDIRRFIADGNSRDVYKGAFAPRVGASYDVFADRRTVVFGGWGRSYSRTMANHAIDEQQKNAQPNGEIWLVANELKMPYADQFSLGVRQAVGRWNAEVTLSRINAKNQFVWFSGNRDPNGGFGTQSPLDPLWGGPAGYGQLVLGDFVGETRTDALLVSLAKPYTRSSGWSANVAYTYSDAKTTHNEWNNDIFDWTYGKPASVRGWHPSTLVAKHRLVLAGLADGILPWGIVVAAKLNYDDGLPRRLTNCSAGFSACVSTEGDAPSYTQLDLSVSKNFSLWGYGVGLRADVLNLFNKTNYGGFDDWVGGPGAANYLGGDNPNLLKPNSIRGDTRTLRLALNVKF